MHDEEILDERKRYALLSSRDLLEELKSIGANEALVSRLLILTEACERFLEYKIWNDSLED